MSCPTNTGCNKSSEDELYELANQVRSIFVDYRHLDGHIRCCYALVVARTIAAEEGYTELQKAIEDTQELMPQSVYDQWVPALKRVLAKVRRDKPSDR
tara:strand:- start:194 stop:487 length:294 start_codon:yes stop_codon:yes gene_type:complete